MDLPPAPTHGMTNSSALQSRNTSVRGSGHVNGTRGRTNGLVNGNGRTNGLGNGVGRTNGLVNGVGRTNGLTNGLTNGVRPPNGQPARPLFRSVTRRDLRAAYGIFGGSVAVMLLLSLLLGTQVPPAPPYVFAVDGNFTEWRYVPLNAGPVDSGPAQANLLAYAVHAEGSQLFAYAKTRGPLFAGPTVSSVYVLVHDPARPGYDAPETDAEFVAEIWGWNGALQGTLLRQWNGAADRDNASALQPVGPFPAIAVGDEIELALDRNLIGFDPALQAVVAAHASEVLGLGAVVGLSPGALVVEEAPLTNVLSGPTPVLQLTFRALARDIRVNGVTFDLVGGGTVLSLALPFWVAAGQNTTQTVTLDPGLLPAGQFVTLRVSAVDAVTTANGTAVPTTIAGPEARAYIQILPAAKTIDGVFNDWTNTTPDPIDPIPDHLDIVASAMSVPGNAYFYLETRGDILAGAILPERRLPLPPTNGSVPPPLWLPRRAGLDVLRAYVETDSGNVSGQSIGAITANRMIEVTGRLGQIRSTSLFTWNSTTSNWDLVSELPNVAFAGTQIEASVSAAFLGPVFNPLTVFAMSDWSRSWDITDVPIPSNAPSLMVSVGPLHANPPNQISATLLVNTPAIDGNCASSGGEYNGASMGSNAALRFFVGRRDDTQFVYLCIQVTADTAGNKNDWGEIIFDTLHNGGSTPQVDDKLFYVFGNGDAVLKRWQGNGVGWDPQCLACDLGDAGASRFAANEFYEFKIRYTDVWGTLLPTGNQTAGFAIIAYDFNAGVAYGWGGPAINENVPDTWGHLFYPIPEFPMPALAAVAMVIIPIVRRRRRAVAPTGVSRGQDATELKVFPSSADGDRAEVAKLGPTRQI